MERLRDDHPARPAKKWPALHFGTLRPNVQGRLRCSPIRFSGYASEQYQVDPAKQDTAVLAFRDYGDDLSGRLPGAGFASAQFLTPEHAVPWGFTRTLAVARKAGTCRD